GPRLFGTPNDQAAVSAVAEPENPVLYWVAPMDPKFKSDKPGKSPMGMDLVPIYADSATDGEGVTITAAVENNLGVRTEKAKVRPLWRRIEATGYVGFDETRISHISTRVQGWISNLQVNSEGERVTKGDLLFELYSPELVNAQKEYLQALQRGENRLLKGADEKLCALGMIPSEVKLLAERGTASENIRIIAPQDGIVSSLSVRDGMYIQPNTAIMSLADLSSVWLQAEVFESQADWVAAGQAAEATLDYMPGVEFSGQVDYVYPVLDPVTRTLSVRVRFENPDERLKPNMYSRVSIYGRLKPNALSIPREALIPAPGRDRVVVAMGDGKFHVHEVMTGLESGEYVEILAGISEGDEIVTSSQFLIDSEASLAGSINRLESVDSLPEHRELGSVFASGWVDGVDQQSRRLRVSHGPIDVLGWPSMTMVFDVRPAVDFSRVKVGQNIQFSLVQEHAGEYEIEQIISGEKESGGSPQAQAGQGPDEAVPVKDTPEVEERRITARAVVRGVDPGGRQVKLEHEAIAELKWPAMTMSFAVGPSVAMDAIEAGQNIHFSMVETPAGGWLIDQIHVLGKATAAGDRNDD
ncbi:MAG: efflux RND transporter periplasmic adaptor subunit, partial [Xanthomonadales bacterium]|nr:efflux RND transporter periplasmic adaptor subunit [Xanthomonadales bacterium]